MADQARERCGDARDRRNRAHQTARLALRRACADCRARAGQGLACGGGRDRGSGCFMTRSGGRAPSFHRRPPRTEVRLARASSRTDCRALLLLARVALGMSPFALLALVAAMLGPRSRAHSRLGWASFVAALIFLALPFGYASDVAQLATGASLRFAAPAIVAGALLMAPVARSAPRAATGESCAYPCFSEQRFCMRSFGTTRRRAPPPPSLCLQSPR